MLLNELLRINPGLERYIYHLAYIYKYAKNMNIDLNYKMHNCNDSFDLQSYFLQELKNEIYHDDILKLAVDNLPANIKVSNYEKVLEYYNNLTISELSKLSLLTDNSNIYNAGTPDSLIDLSYNLLETTKGIEVLDIGVNEGNFLINYSNKTTGYIFNGIDININSCIISRLRLALQGVEGRIRQADEFLCINEKYDKVFSNHPFLSKPNEIMLDTINKHNGLDCDFNPTVSADWFFVEKARQFMSDKGKAVCIVLNSSLSKMTDSYIRQSMIEKGFIEAIISLPPRIFPYTGISSSIVVLSNNNKSIKMIDGSKFFNPGRRMNEIKVNEIMDLYNSTYDNSDYSKTVSISDFKDNGCLLMVERYLDNYKVDLENPVTLESVCENIFRGYQISAKEMDVNHKTDKFERKYRVLNVGNITDGFIDYLLDSVYVEKDNLDKYLINDGDILISCKSSKIKIALFESKDNNDIIASGNLIVVRPNKKKIVPAYLKMFLDSKKGRKLLTTIQTGSTIISINPSALKEMNIPLLDFEKQEFLASNYMSKIDNLSIYKKRIKQLEDDIQNYSDNSF